MLRSTSGRNPSNWRTGSSDLPPGPDWLTAATFNDPAWGRLKRVAVATGAFPLALPGLLAGCLLTFVLAMGAYITPMILGGPGTTYYANLVFETFVSQQNWPFGATLSLVIIFFLTLGLFGYARLAGISSMFREARA